MTTWWPYARLVTAVLGLAAILAQLERSVGISLRETTAWGSHIPTTVANFFSFFTILSNVSAVLILGTLAIWAWTKGRDGRTEPRVLSVLLACTSTYMVVTGVVYNTLLRGVELPQGSTVGWSNEVMHVIVPLVLLVDVLLAPRRRWLAWSTVPIIAIFPLVWAAYTLVRANLVVSPSTGNPWWYPYPFLDPHLVPGGYLGVAGYIVGIAIAIVGVASLVVWVARRRGTVPAR